MREKERLPLSHLTVLEYGAMTAFCGRVLCDLGARVLKIEPPEGDTARETPHLPEDSTKDASLHFFYLNHGKKFITLNLNKKEGRDIFFQLVRRADVFITTFSSHMLKVLGLQYGSLARVNKRLIMVCINDEQKKPEVPKGQNNEATGAVSGLLEIIDRRDLKRREFFHQQVNYLPSLFATTAVLMALNARGASNKGQQIKISPQDCMSSLLLPVLANTGFAERISLRESADLWGNSSGVFRCRDGWIYLTFEREWDTLVQWMNSEGVGREMQESAWNSPEYRRENREHVVKTIGKWTEKHSADELFETARLMRFPWAPLKKFSDLLKNPQLKSRRFFIHVSGENGNEMFALPRSPLLKKTLSRETSYVPRSAGSDNENIYCKELGISRDRLTELVKNGVI